MLDLAQLPVSLAVDEQASVNGAGKRSSSKILNFRLFGNTFTIEMQRLQQITELRSQQILYTISGNDANTYL